MSYMLGISKITNLMAKDNINGRINVNIKVSGKKEKWMDKVHLYGLQRANKITQIKKKKIWMTNKFNKSLNEIILEENIVDNI